MAWSELQMKNDSQCFLLSTYPAISFICHQRLSTSPPPRRLDASLAELSAVFTSHGLQLPSLAAARPDLLLQSATSLNTKLAALPAALGLPPRRARDVVAACPQLLRR